MKPELLEVVETRALDRVDARTPEHRTNVLYAPQRRGHLSCLLRIKPTKPAIEHVGRHDFPSPSGATR
jgi:hypothetical protein